MKCASESYPCLAGALLKKHDRDRDIRADEVFSRGAALGASSRMKWPKGKKKNGSAKKKKAGSQQSTPTKPAAADQRSQVSTSGGSAGGGSLGLGTLRLGTLRADSSSAPMCTPTPTSRRQSISDLLGPDTDGEGEDLSTVTASPALRNIISNRKSLSGSFDTKRGKGDSITTYTSEEKVRERTTATPTRTAGWLCY